MGVVPLITLISGRGLGVVDQEKMADIRRSAEALGTILSAEPSEEQKRRFEEHIDRCRSSPGFLQKVINHPIQRYNGRTLVHIAADKGLNEYLETLLNEGG